MNAEKYVLLQVQVASQDQAETMVALLTPLGFDGFEENDTALSGYGLTGAVQLDEVEALLAQLGYTYTITYIAEQNWNALWESNFEPVRVGDFAGVRAHFHPPFHPPVTYDIHITPKMSFGTGHHATTRMVMECMQQLPVQGCSVLDFGTGTGILAILAALMGAKSVVAIDNDEWCITNSKENTAVNGVDFVDVHLADSIAPYAAVDILLANINKHILLQAAPLFSERVLPGGYLVMSGLLYTDEEDICNSLPSEIFEKKEVKHLGDWIAIVFQKNVE